MNIYTFFKEMQQLMHSVHYIDDYLLSRFQIMQDLFIM
jgi:hypothetical protein